MSLLLRAALLGGIAYLITRSLSHNAGRLSHRRSAMHGEDGAAPLGELHPGENHVWPTSESQQRAAAAAGPSS
jgi:hypothetical protein